MKKKTDDSNALDTLRHSCAHVMAAAVKALYPQAHFGVGPAVENGFYYDVELAEPLGDDDLAAIEKKMAEIVKNDHPFERKEIPRDEAKKLFAAAGERFKVEIIDQISSEEKISTYTLGGFTDLCRGPHVESAGKIQAFKLLSVAGAYWRGDERNPMMRRIYGTAFFDKKELNGYLRMIEEAKKRDHRKLGKELDFFSFHEEAGPGLIFYHPKGAMLRHFIEQYIKAEHIRRGYHFVLGPQILKSDTWKISGHYAYYKENMYICPADEDKEYAVKPMNCPGHMLIYKTRIRSYREFPLRFFEMGTVCRNEKSGVLHGLLRVRNFTQDDAHIFCLPEQLEGEIVSVLNFVFDVLKAFGFNEYAISLSTRPKESIGTDRMWEKATTALRGALEAKKLEFGIEPEGGAFYGPKIDVQIKDALGRSWQCSTIQCDFALPEKFDLEYVAQDGSRQRPVMVHRAILGSVERFMGTLIEHYAGALPLWLSPVQAAILPVSKPHEAYCGELAAKLEAAGLRVRATDSTETLGRRIREAQTEKIPFVLVAGDREAESGGVTVRRRGSKDQTACGVDEFIALCNKEIEERK